MRADRLIAALMILQTRGKVTAAEIADELEISVRTARRDLEALAMSGVPIYSQPGRGGGWQLIGQAKTDLTGLSADEAQALFLALGQHTESSPLLDAALRKLVVALPEGFRGEALAATTAIKVDPAGWGHIGPVFQPEFVSQLSEAVISAYQVKIRYAAPGKTATNRIVHPLGLVTKRGVWYLIANTSRGLRTFRLSRIQQVDPRVEPVDCPPDFDLDEAWEAIVSYVEQQRGGLHVRVVAEPEVATPMSYVFANRCEVLSTHPDGSIEYEITETSARSLAAQLAGFGKSIRVLNPPASLTSEMKRIANELAAQWT